MFAIDEESKEVLHYTEDNDAAKMAGARPPANCGVYFFSTRVYEEFGIPRYENVISPRDGSTPKEHIHSVKSGTSGMSELAKLSHSHIVPHISA